MNLPIKQGIRRILDVLLLPFTILAAKWFWWLRNQKIENFPATRKVFRHIGVFPIIDHYYEPLFLGKDLIREDGIARELYLDWNTQAQLKLLAQFNFQNELLAIPTEKSKGFYYSNESFGTGDAEYWYNMIRYFKPKRIIEVGCGNSTILTQLALSANTRDDINYHYEHTCIEPYERHWLEELGLNVIRERVEKVNKTIFRTLGSGDILFIDNSHVVRPQGDVVVLFTEILPCLQSGVIVHFHDIFTPFDYPKQWMIDWVRIFGEQYVLEAFLYQNSEWKIIGALNYLKHFHYKNLKLACPLIDESREPGSFYIQKV